MELDYISDQAGKNKLQIYPLRHTYPPLLCSLSANPNLPSPTHLSIASGHPPSLSPAPFTHSYLPTPSTNRFPSFSIGQNHLPSRRTRSLRRPN
ncbi:hypothetical protein NPIL_18161 [Nephila pilipes]|uniref:Uncharacterized protein n=1 Tax=Nephila pilipes TaxID=299642 RepID=A0A8X6UPF2_NEPPI|nr:hypothetical protein NPIL_18161 [Nephila pilipes]